MNICYNNALHKLDEEVTIIGGRVDPLSEEQGSISIRNNPDPGIVFQIGNNIIPYNDVQCTDGPVGRMLYVESEDQKLRAYLVEHIVSALGLAGLHDVIVEVGESCYAPTFTLFSRKDSKILSPRIRSYCIPIPGPGVDGFLRRLTPNTTKNSDQGTRDVVRCTNKAVHQIADQNPKYKGILREFSVEPCDHFEVVIQSSHHPDIEEIIPPHEGICLRDSDDLSQQTDARPVARVTAKWKYHLLRMISQRSEAITPKTYFMASPGETPQGLVQKMRPRYQDDKNEHLYHTAIADLVSELIDQFGSSILKMRIIISDSNHRFRLDALRELQSRGIFHRGVEG